MRPRVIALVTAVMLVVAGLAVRTATGGAFAKYAGVALYAALVYVLVVLVVPRASPVVVAGAAVAICWAVELAQLTPVPSELSSRSTLARLVLGSTFNPPDLVWYAIGTACALALHRAVLVRGP